MFGTSVLMFDAAYPPPTIGGKEKQAQLLSENLVRAGVKVKVMSFEHNGNCTSICGGVSVNRFKRSVIGYLCFFMFILLSRWKCDVLHIHTPSRIGKVVACVGWALGYKIVFKFPNENMMDAESPLDKLLWGLTLRVASSLVVLEQKTRIELSHRGLGSKIFFVANGVEQNKIKPSRSRGTFKILFVGRLVPQKRCGDLFRACAILRHEFQDWELIITGEGPLRDQLSELAKELLIDGHVRFSEHKKKPLNDMCTVDVLVLPSEKEGMSNVILEAMSIGLPVIATDVGAAREQLGPVGEQFLCKVNNPADLAYKLSRLLKAPSLKAEYGEYLYKRCLERFTIDAVAARYLEMYESI